MPNLDQQTNCISKKEQQPQTETNVPIGDINSEEAKWHETKFPPLKLMV